jgi:hypothetical protein
MACEAGLSAGALHAPPSGALTHPTPNLLIS